MNLIKEHIRVKLELFEGPLDLLLHLIKTQHIDIAAIPIARITEQYLETIELMKTLDLDIAGEYLVMAATLMLIKSRMLLPPTPGSDEEESAEDMREELVRRLKEYETFKQAGTHLELLEKERELVYTRDLDDSDEEPLTEWVIEASVVALINALGSIMDRHKEMPVHLVRPNPVSVRKKMSMILQRLNADGPLLFTELFNHCRFKQDVIGTFLAILELMKMQALQARQKSNFSEIRLVLTGPKHRNSA